jgi:hypothetical protein
MKLQLFFEMGNDKQVSLQNHIIDTNPKLQLQPKIKMSANEKNLSEAPWLIGFLLDVSLPSLDLEKKLKTGYSGHIYGGYFVSSTFLLSLRIGYIGFGTRIIEDYAQKREYEQSYVPLLFGIYYIFGTGGFFRPYIGLALGPMIQSYSQKITNKDDYYVFNDSSTELTFGFVPEFGFYYFIKPTRMIQVSVSYSFAGSGIAPTLGEGQGLGTYLSILGGFSFALGGD